VRIDRYRSIEESAECCSVPARVIGELNGQAVLPFGYRTIYCGAERRQRTYPNPCVDPALSRNRQVQVYDSTSGDNNRFWLFYSRQKALHSKRSLEIEIFHLRLCNRDP